MRSVALSAAAFAMAAAFIFTPVAGALARTGEVSIQVEIDTPAGSGDTRLWLPYPVNDRWQKIDDIKVDGNFTKSGVYKEKATGNSILYAEWTKPVDKRTLSFTFKADASERVKKDFPAEKGGIPAEVKPYTQGSKFIPVDGKVKEIADKAVAGKKTTLEKARAVYDWVVENTFRDPSIAGCGTGDVERMLAEKGGKCADISSVFVAVARAAGVPAREVFGIRLGKGAEEDITGGYHCWSEFYYPGYGWVPVDPADVRKAMLTEKLELEAAGKHREYYFGAVDEYRVVLATGGRGYYLNPPQKDGPINYFMYPYAEADGKQLDWTTQKELKYRVIFKEIK